MSPIRRYKLRPLVAFLVLLMLIGVGVLAYQHFGSFSLYVNGKPVHGPGAYFGLLGGIFVAGLLILGLLAGMGVIALGILLLVGSLVLFAAAPLLWPLVLVAAIIYLLVALTRRR